MTAPIPADLPDGAPASEVRRQRRKALLLLGVPVLVAVLIGVTIWLIKGGGGEKVEPFELRGVITLDSSDTTMGKLRNDGYHECSGERGYSDLRAGAQVTVYDASGKAIALGNVNDSQRKDGRCTLSFVVADVPGGQGIYEVEVAHRGKVRYDEERAKSGTVSLTLG